ncbi:MAG: PAS domain-containing sensor histidine kinase [Nostocales cyanobacterium]|nr:MAG: PAS domain-containing sensor histidine kinase [Nostocales cyanobacterium]TAF12739.1 MAG: PAS domain-containing sensor histidine kinase [Nostocales cyanobacterium]
MKTHPVKLIKLSKSLASKIQKIPDQKIPDFFFDTELDQNSKQFLLSMYDSLQTSIFIVDVLEDGDFSYFAINPTHERWLGISSEKLRGKKPEDILSPIDAAKVRQHYHECVQLGATISYKQCLQFQGINTSWSTTLTPLKNHESRIYRLIGTSTNINTSNLVEKIEIQQQIQQIQYLEEQLEIQQKNHQIQLQKINSYHALVRKITEKICSQVELNQLFQTIVYDLSQLLELEQCQIELYNHDQTIATVTYKYSPSSNTSNSYPTQKITRKVDEFPEIYQILLKKQPFQSIEILPGNPLKIEIICQLGYPIFDAQGIIGNIWLIKSTAEEFKDLEISLVQEIANECAIAIRQSQLQEKTTAQLKEIEKREKRKHEFLKTLSQELSTPVTNINLAVQTLENLLTSLGIIDIESVPQLLQILHNESNRENQLINDLLKLTYLKNSTEKPILSSIDIEKCLKSTIASFQDLAYLQQQKLNLQIPHNLPNLTTDIIDFQQIISKLITHACQCTPPDEFITITANSHQQTFTLKLSYSGVEIPRHELEKVLQPFYRFTKNDPWKYSTSGLELVLVKEMVKRLNGKINVQSTNKQITFTVKLPLDPVFSLHH